MTEQYLLGIDAGTSVIKAALFDVNGKELAVAQRPTRVLMPQSGWSETDMFATWEMCVAVIRDIATHPLLRDGVIAGIGVSGNMIGAWMIDKDGLPVRNAILWSDARAHPLLAQMEAESPGFTDRVFALDGCVIEAGSTLALLRWFAENDPIALQQARYVFSSKDWLVYQLTGIAQMDSSEAAVLPGNTRTQQVDDELLDLFGIKAYRHLLPPVYASESVAGFITAEVAALTGLKAGTSVVSGAGDVPANALGIGAVTPGMAFAILGTNCQSCLVYDQPVFTPPGVGLLFYVPGNRWFRALMNVAGTTNLDWFVEQFGTEERAAAISRDDLYNRIEASARRSPIGANGVLYHPYLGVAGVIAPFVEPAARAQFTGLNPTHTRADMLRAVYEGTAMAIRDCYTALSPTLERPISRIVLAGGGSRSPFWSQIIADCLNAEVVIPLGHEFGAKGAALLAGVAVGIFPDVITASTNATQWSRVVQPDGEAHRIYTHVYERYHAVRGAMQAVWSETKSDYS